MTRENSKINGHSVYFDESQDAWFYSDTNEPIENNHRPCKKCGRLEIDENGERVDECLGRLPGVKYACCGHGDPRYAYIYFENGVVIRGFNEIEHIS